METVKVPERRLYWQNFDIQYHSSHSQLRHMKRVLWELPHWMHWLAGVLATHGYTSFEVIDLYTSTESVSGRSILNRDRIEMAIKQHPGDVFLFSPMTVNLHLAYEIADTVKAVYPDAQTIFGGVVATPMHEQVASHPNVDYVVVDRGEVALPALLDTIVKNESPNDVRNLTFKRADGSIVSNKLSYPSISPSNLPFPVIDLFPASAGEDIRYIRQVYALGCPYKCSYCTIQTIGRKPDYFSIERIISEIRAYREYYGNHHSIYWGDETFTLHTERTLALLSALEEEGDIEFDCQTRLNCLNNDRVLHALQRAGCRWIEIGLETNSQDSHNLHKNKMKLGTTEETLLRVRDAGLTACSFGVNGFPEQSLDGMRRSVEWLCDLIDRDLLQASHFAQLVPYPGSVMYSEPERFGMRLLHKDFSFYGEDQPPVYETVHGNSDQIYDVFLEGLDCLAQAMSKRPYFADTPVGSDRSEYGSFWSSAHV